MNKNTKLTGNFGEEITEKFLVKKKYKILERNYNTKLGEIDIIAANKSNIIFVEVKTRGVNSLGFPAEAVTKSKQKKIIKTAFLYLMHNPCELQPRFDVSEVYISENKSYKINYIENAFIQEDDYAAF
ncbi:MAG: YraN family protein [Ruminococcus sp.]|nr:YraN family protein [Ruminococcus sp.]